MLDNGAEIDRAMEDGATPLYIACRNGQLDVARLLLARGADAERANQQGTTPLDAAKKCRHDAVVALIEDHLSKADDVVAMTPPAAPVRRRTGGKCLTKVAVASKRKALEEREEARAETKRLQVGKGVALLSTTSECHKRIDQLERGNRKLADYCIQLGGEPGLVTRLQSGPGDYG